MNDWKRLAKSLIKNLGLTQAAVSEKVGVTPGQLNHWLTGRRVPNIEEFSAFAESIGVSAEYLLSGRIGASDMSQREIDLVSKIRRLSPEQLARIEERVDIWLEATPGGVDDRRPKAAARPAPRRSGRAK